MKITLKANIGGVLKQIDAIVASLKDVDKMLGKFGKHMRNKVQKKFDEGGPGWQGLAASTMKKREGGGEAKGASRITQVATVRLAKKIKREFRRAKQSGNHTLAARKKAAYESLQKLNAGESIGEPPKLTASEKSAVSNRKKLIKSLKGNTPIKEINKRLDAYDSSHKTALISAANKGALNATHKLSQRLQREQQKSAGKILGRMSASIYAKAKGGTLEVGSKIPWAGVHNDGGTAGHGAHEPERKFLELETADMDVLVAIIEETVEEAQE